MSKTESWDCVYLACCESDAEVCDPNLRTTPEDNRILDS